MSARLALATPVVIALGCAALVQSQRHPELAIGGGGPWAAALQLAAGLGTFAAGADLALRRSLRLPGALLLASGVALLLGMVPPPEGGSAALFTAALAFG